MDPLSALATAADFYRSVVRVSDFNSLLPLKEKAIAHQRALLAAEQAIIDLQRENAKLRRVLEDREQDPVRIVEGIAWTAADGPFCPNCWLVKDERRLLSKRWNSYYAGGLTHSCTVDCSKCSFRQVLKPGFNNPLRQPDATGS